MNKGNNVLFPQINKALRRLPYLWRGVRLVWQASPGWTTAWLGLLLVQGLLPALTVNLTRLVVDGMVIVINQRGDWASLRPTVVWIALLALAMLLQELLRSLNSMIRTAQSERIRDHVSALIHQKSIEIDLSLYDDPDFYDMLHRARIGAASRPMTLLESIGVIFQHGVTLIAMTLILLPYGLWLPIALLISTLPAFFVVLYHRLRLHQWTIQNTSRERKVWYYDYLLTARESAPEVRLFQLGHHFQGIYQGLRRSLREERIRLSKDQGLAELGAGFTALAVTALSMAWMIWRAFQGLVSLGDLALFYQAFNQGQQLMRSFMENVGEIYTNTFFLADLFEFLALQPRIPEPAQPQPVQTPLTRGIHFKDVTFGYPGNQRATLSNFNLHLQPGQIAAIVGANGAGKSTLVKLICRFYDPAEGSITLDGVDLRQFDLQELRRNITVLFQEPVHYSATVRENIALGSINAEPTLEAVSAAAQAAGADVHIQRLPEGYETLLGKWFQGGADLSVGEWQRLALARAFLRQAPIIILDEPTSAMDPWAEADWLNRFRALAAGRIAILITHRFTTAAYADVIHVLDNGQIVESGDHHALLAQKGRYAASWIEQMQRWLEASQPLPSLDQAVAS